MRGKKSYFYKIPFLGKFFLKRRGKKEKEEWIRICRLVVDSQCLGPKFESLTDCPFCHSKNINILLSSLDRLTNKEGTFFLSKCANCGLIFQNPRVKEKYIGDYYISELGYYHSHKNSLKKTFFSRLKEFVYTQVLVNQFNYRHLGHKNIFSYIATLIFRKEMKINLTPNYIENGNLLEIGCAHGARLEKLRNLGWKVVGIEMDKRSSEYAQKTRKLKIINNKVEKISFPKNKFDVIIMSMVLEHLYHPFESLKRIAHWLKPGGQLLFSIPYFDGLEFSLFKEYAYGLHLPHHITFFNKEILKKYLEELGYKDIKFYFQHFHRDITGSAYYKYLDTNKYFYKFIATNKIFRKLIITPILFILSSLGKTSRVSIIASKS